MRRHRTELIGEGRLFATLHEALDAIRAKARKVDLLRSTPQRLGVHGALDLEPAAGQADAYCR
jgi:hypothetical protein